MSRRANAAKRCLRCRMHAGLCVCALIPRLETRTRLVLVIHRIENRRTTNTGRLATECLVNSEVVVRGNRESPTVPLSLPPETNVLLLFPFEGAVDIRTFADHASPVALVVPDGNWRQASKARNRVPGLREATAVSLPPGPLSDYRLREESHEERVCTLEAIARALGVLEGAQVQRPLEEALALMVSRTLHARDARVGLRPLGASQRHST